MEVSNMHMMMNITQNSAKMISHNKHNPIISKNYSKPKVIACQVSMQSTGSGIKTNFYQLLSLTSQNVGFDEIKKAYKNLALQYHPDVVCDLTLKEESAKKFIELRQAYETLSDPDSRRVYDHELLTGLEEPFGSNFGSSKRKDMQCNFSREVWERQLNGLRKRSAERLMKKIKKI